MNRIYILKLHKIEDGKEICINANNILYYGFDAVTGGTVIITNSLKGNKFEVKETFQKIDDIFNNGE